MRLNFAINERFSIYPSNLAWLKNLLNNGFLLAALAAFASSSKAILVKLIYQDTPIDPLVLLTLRLLIALPFFIWLTLAFGKTARQPLRAINLRTGLVILWLGFTGYYFASLTDFIGLTYISAGLERLVLFTYPTLVMLIEAFWKRQMPSLKTFIGVLLCYLGLSAAFGHDLANASNTANLWLGVFWVFLSGFSFALYYLGAGNTIRKLGSRRFTGLAGLAACLFTFVHFSLTQETSSLTDLPVKTWYLAGLMAILCTILPSLLMAAAIVKIGPSSTANVGTLGPVMTILLAWIVLGEAMSTLQITGLVLVLIGVSRMK